MTTTTASARPIDPPDPRPGASPSAPEAHGRSNGATLRVARWSARHPWSAMGAWVAFVAICLVVGGMVGVRELAPSESGSGESARADAAVETGGFPVVPQEQVIVADRDGALDEQRAAEAFAALQAAYAGVPAVTEVGEPIPSADGTSILVPVALDDGGRAGEDAVLHAEEHVQAVLDATAGVQAQFDDLWVEQAGEASVNIAVEEQVAQDFRLAEVLSIPVTLLILVLAFGALIAAGVPVLLAATAVSAAIGLSAIASQVIPVTQELTSVILLIGMAVGVDYSLFYVRRAREERLAGAGRIDAVEIAAATSGRAVLVSGFAVMVAMAGMFISGSPVFVSFAVGTIIVVAVAMVGSLTVLPAVLAKLGPRVDRPRVPLVHRLQRHGGRSRFWPWAMRLVLARPAVSLTLGVALLVGLALPALGMQLRSGGIDSLPGDIPAVQTYERIIAAYPAEGAAHTVVVWDEEPLDRAGLDAALLALAQGADADDRFLPAPAVAELSPSGQVARIEVGVPFGYGTTEASESLQALRGELVPAAFAPLVAETGAEVAVTGAVASNDDFTTQMASRLPFVIGFVLLLSFIVLTMAFRSIVIAATAIVLNMLSVGAAYGLLVLVFQGEWAEGLLGFTSSGAVISWLPLFLFVVLFGLSMDYHVFVVSRIREAHLRGVPTKQAIASGVVASASVVTSAAAVMIGVFSIFATMSLLEFKQLGVGLAAAVLIDATLVRVVLLPSAMALLGRWNWYLPKALQWLPSLEEPQVTPDSEPLAVASEPRAGVPA